MWCDRTPIPKAVVFDVDGTLVDSERNGHRVAFNEAFTAADLPYHWDERTYGDLLRLTGGKRRLRSFLSQQGHPDRQAAALAETLHRDKTELFREMCVQGRIPPRPGVVRLLDELTAAGITIAVATTGTRAWVDPLLDRAFGPDRFALVLTGTEVPVLKPHPDVYIEALRRLGVDGNQAAAVEDSANGMVAAHAAGLACLVVVNDYTADQALAQADVVVDGFGRPGAARIIAGPEDAVDNGAVTPSTFERLLRVRL
jgi:HAD superfamily hydrolase (TIGR01509 family)